jgi:hypothetical protein
MEAQLNKITKLLISLTAMLAAGCAENTMAPKASRADATIPGGGATAALTTTDTTRFSFLIDSKRTLTYSLGAGNTITFPAKSMCDVNSTYGVDQWDKPCVVSKDSLTVNAKAWLDANGFPHVDFDKHIRFVPDPKLSVMISLDPYGAATSPWSTINYCPTLDPASCFDESVNDPSLATTVDPISGRMTRRLKHFSGYSLTSGRDEAF